MTDMTDEELDEARAREASRRVNRRLGVFEIDSRAFGREAARLAREGWVPVDPDLLDAREVVRKLNETFYPDFARRVARGECDGHIEVRTALTAIRATKAKMGAGS